MQQVLDTIADWCNQNSGFVTLLLFILSLLIGWISGLFNVIRKRPKFIIKTIEGATFGCIIDLKRKYQNLPVHKTAFVLYLEVKNIGNAPSSIGDISLGYLKSDFNPKWKAKRLWLKETVSKGDFTLQFNESEKIKVLPFLKQKNNLYENTIDNYLDIGKISTGIVYFEEQEAFGNWMPRLNKDHKTTDIKLKIIDSFNGAHIKSIRVNIIEPEKALTMNPYFAQTYNEYFVPKDKGTENQESE